MDWWREETWLQNRYRWCPQPFIYAHMCAKPSLHKDGISFHHLCRAVERKAVESVDQVFVQDVQVLHFLH